MDLEKVEKLPWGVQKKVYGKIPFKFIGKMVEMAESTMADKRERISAICYSGVLGTYMTRTRIGGKLSSSLPPDVCGKDKYVGSFHTHPDEFTDPSPADFLYQMNRKEEKVTCVGAPVLQKEEIGKTTLSYPTVVVKCSVMNRQHPELKDYVDKVNKIHRAHKHILSAVRSMARSGIIESILDYYQSQLDKLRSEWFNLLDEMEKKGIISFEHGVRTTKDKVYIERVDIGEVRL